MFALLLLAAAIPLGAPTPQPSAAPPLKTIASVRSSTRCAEIITHANSAIGTTLDDDAIVGKTIATLRLTNLDDGNAIHRRNSFIAIGDLAKTLTLQSRAGDDEVKRLRAMAAKGKDPQSAKQLKDFADELGGALWRQQRIARDLNGFLAYEDFKDMTAWSDSQKEMNHSTFGVDDPQAQMPVDVQPRDRYGDQWSPMHPNIGHDPNEPDATTYAKAAADDFQARVPDILNDESHAAIHIDGALAGCR